MEPIQNGLIGLGAFIALSKGVKPLLILIFCILFWSYDEVKKRTKQTK